MVMLVKVVNLSLCFKYYFRNHKFNVAAPVY